MPDDPGLQHSRSELRLVALALASLCLPERLSEALVEADYAVSLARNEALRRSSAEEQRKRVQELREATVKRFRLLRRRLAISALSMTSAIGVALLFQMLPVPAVSGTCLAVGSVFCFATATLGRLGWAGQSIKGDTAPERLDQLIFHMLYWSGMYLGAVAML